jgi:Ca2+-binding RTX toxin-like protein
MSWFDRFMKKSSHSKIRRPFYQSELRPLEDRVAPANLVWANRGQASDRFDDVFGANANSARAVVDAVLTGWGAVLTNLNQPPVDGTVDSNTINFTIGMDAVRTGFGGGATITNWAFPTQADKDANRNGHPTAGSFTLDRGTAGQPDNGWWIDPTPLEHSEFTNVLTPYAASRPEGSVGTDLYGTINAEIAHILGLFDTAPSRFTTPVAGTITKTKLKDFAHGGGRGFYYVFDGPSGTHLLTSYDSGAGDVGNPTHSAGPTARNFPVAFTSQFRTPAATRLTGSLDAGNAAGGDQTRVLASDNIANLLKDAFGYTVRLPSTIPGATYAVAVAPGGQLNVRGGPDGEGPATGAPAANGAPSNVPPLGNSAHSYDEIIGNYRDTSRLTSSDRITLKRDGTDLVVTVDYGRDGPVGGLDSDGNGDAPALVTRVPIGTFTSIRLDADGGNDRVTFDFTGGNFLPAGGVVFDGDLGTDELTVIGAGTFDLDADSVTVGGIGTIDLSSVATVVLSGGATADTFTVRGWVGGLTLNGATGSDIYNLDAATAVTAKITDTGGVADRLELSGTANNDVIRAYAGYVRMGPALVRYASGIEELIIDGLAGNDLLQVAGNSPGTRVTLSGGAGNDRLIGSAASEVIDGGIDNDTISGLGGNDLLLGGSGDDTLTGRGVLIGGLGSDILRGAGSILIGGSTTYDGLPNLANVHALWGRTDLTYTQRVDHLRIGGPVGVFPLTPAVIVDDLSQDRLIGSSALDWFFLNPLDLETGRRTNEAFN